MIKGIIVGAGRAGSFLHFGALQAAGASVLGFVDSNIELLDATTRKYNLPHKFTSIEEAFAKIKDLDFVDICSNTKSHFPIAKYAVERNCHVLVEKPITETLEELIELKKISKASNKTICSVHNHKFYPGIQELRAQLKRGELGEVIFIHREMSFVQEKVRMMEPEHWAHKIPGGRLFEANPHNLYLLYGIEKDLKLIDLFPQKTSLRWPHVVSDGFLANLQTNKCQATIHMSLNCHESSYGKHGPNYLIVTGTKKTVLVDYQKVVNLGELQKKKIAKPNLISRFKGISRRKIKRDTTGEPINEGYNSGHYWMIKEFIEYISGKSTEEPVPFDESFYVQSMNLEMGFRLENKLKGNT